MKKIFVLCIVLGAAGLIASLISEEVYDKPLGYMLALGIVLLNIGIFGRILAPFILGNRAKRKLIQNGILTIGEVSSAKQTGLRVNNQPQLELGIKITLANGTEVEGKVKEIILLTDLANITPGTILPIRYDENDPQKMAIDNQSPQAELQEAYNNVAIQKGILDPELLEISKNGLKGTGVLMESKPTGKVKDNRVEMRLKFVVTPEYGEPFESEFDRYMTQVAIPQLYVGAVFEVHYLRSNKSKLSIKMKAG